MEVKFYLVRHGETVFNRKGRIQGVSDSPMTPKGIKQAEAASEALASIHFDRAYSSPSERAIDTAKIILEGSDIQLDINENLHEFDFGRYEGTRFTSHPDELRNCFAINDFSSVDGETRARMEVRVRETMQAIARECEDGDRVLLVSHGMFEIFLIRTLLDFDIDAYQKEAEKNNKNVIPNGGIMEFSCTDGEWKLVSLPSEPEQFKPSAENKTVHFYYVRHGETLFNMFNRMQGWCDSPLTPNGIAQAKAAAHVLRHVDLRHIYSSTSSRAWRTAQIINEKHRLEIKPCKGLKEVNFGDFDGVVRDSWTNEIHRRHMTETWDDVGGENEAQVRKRILDTLDMIVKTAKNNENVLLVSHGTYYLNMLKVLFGIDRDQYFVERMSQGMQAMPNGGIFTFTYTNGSYVIDELMVPPEEFKE